jgi:hypothetical protein
MKMRAAALALPAILLVAACGGEDSEVDAGEAEISSPIAEFLGQDTDFLSDPEGAEARYIEEERVRQDAIVACMKEQGFEYIATDPSQFISFESSEGFEYGSDEWVDKYGFGITTQRWPQSQLGDGLVGFDDSEMSGDEAPTDPNFEIMQALSPEEQEAYNTALYGEQTFEFDETLSEEEQEAAAQEQTFEMGGCYGEAQSSSDDLSTKFYQEFETELTGMYERAQNDPRVVEWEKKVSDCVAGKGLEYANQEDLYALYEEDLSKIEAKIVYPGADLTEEQMQAMSEEELQELYNQPVDFPDEDRQTLADLQAEEIALAKAVNECDGGMEEQTKIYQEVITEYEQQFLEDNADRLEELKSA